MQANDFHEVGTLLKIATSHSINLYSADDVNIEFYERCHLCEGELMLVIAAIVVGGLVVAGGLNTSPYFKNTYRVFTSHGLGHIFARKKTDTYSYEAV